MPIRRFVLARISMLLVVGVAPALHAQEDPLRGGTFEVGAVIGRAAFQDKTQLEPCAWWGIRIGHRFTPFSGNERLQLGFRASYEACLTDHAEAGRVDVVYASTSWLFGYRASRSWLLYWGTGLGMLLGDSTPGPGDTVTPRFSGHGGPGLTWAFGKHFLADFSLSGIVFEGFELGSSPQERGSTLGVVSTIMLALQI